MACAAAIRQWLVTEEITCPVEKAERSQQKQDDAHRFETEFMPRHQTLFGVFLECQSQCEKKRQKAKENKNARDVGVRSRN